MDLRHTIRKKDGKVHRYWRLVRSVWVGRRVIQQTVAQLGELDERGRIAARTLARRLGAGGGGGAGVSNSGTVATLTNSGAISGGTGGDALTRGVGGGGGAGIANSGTIATLTNGGAIDGGNGGMILFDLVEDGAAAGERSSSREAHRFIARSRLPGLPAVVSLATRPSELAARPCQEQQLCQSDQTASQCVRRDWAHVGYDP
jgi:hypothetical protein